MPNVSYRVAVSLAVGVFAAGCVTYSPYQNQTSAMRCDEAVTQGTAFGHGAARAIAVNSLKNQIGDVRGYLVSQGVRRVRPAERSVTCRPHALGGGLIQCTAVTRFCGR